MTILLAVLSAGLASAAWAGPSFRDPDRTAGLWPEIPFVRGADYAEFTRTMSQSRDTVRRMLQQEFGEPLLPMAGSHADMSELAKVLFQALLTFDRLHDAHREEALQGLQTSLGNLFRAEFDELYRRAGVGDKWRRAEFLNPRSEVVAGVKSRSDDPALPLKILHGVDYVLYGSTTLLGGSRVSVTLTIERLLTGQTRSFEAAAPIQEVARLLAAKVFEFLQSNEYGEWTDPQPRLEWIRPSGTQPRATAAVAALACRSQGARLPYARELLLASQGSQYRPGGLPALEVGAIYIVADRQRHDEPHYLFTGYAGEAEGGPVRSGGGYGVIRGPYWCVRGPVSKEVQFFEDVYRLVRKMKGGKGDERILGALEYILLQLDDFGAYRKYEGRFPSLENAVDFLTRSGYFLRLP